MDKWRSFDEAREFARSLGLNSQFDWQKYCKGQIAGKPEFPKDIPKTPSGRYRSRGWVSWKDWLGINL